MKDKTGYAMFTFMDTVPVVKYKGIVVIGKTLYTLRQWNSSEEEAIAYAEAVLARLVGGENIVDTGETGHAEIFAT